MERILKTSYLFVFFSLFLLFLPNNVTESGRLEKDREVEQVRQRDKKFTNELVSEWDGVPQGCTLSVSEAMASQQVAGGGERERVEDGLNSVFVGRV